MPLTLQMNLEYRRTSLHFVHQHMHVGVAAFMRLTDEEVTDVALSVLAESLEHQRACLSLEVSDFRELTCVIEGFKMLASGRDVHVGKVAVVKATLRAEREGTHPRALRTQDFSLRALFPQSLLLDQASWTRTARDFVVDPRWNRGRFAAVDYDMPSPQRGGTADGGHRNGPLAWSREPSGE